MQIPATRSLVSSAVMLAIVSCTAGCTPTLASQQSSVPGITPFVVSVPSSFEGLPTCDRNMPLSKTVIRVAVNKDLSTTKKERAVKFIKRTSVLVEPDDEEEYKASTVNKGGNGEYQRNLYHIDLQTIPDVPSGNGWVMVRVILKDRAYKFFTGPIGAKQRILGVALESGSKFSSWLCQEPDPKPFTQSMNNKKNVLTFYVKPQPGGDEATINLIIVADPSAGSGATGGFETPIFIDPKIKNNG